MNKVEQYQQTRAAADKARLDLVREQGRITIAPSSDITQVIYMTFNPGGVGSSAAEWGRTINGITRNEAQFIVDSLCELFDLE